MRRQGFYPRAADGEKLPVLSWNYAFFLLVNLLTGVEFSCYIMQAVTTLGVFSSECANTAVERLCDKITSGVDPEIKAIKDISAGAVLCWGITFFLLEFVFIGRAFLC